MQQGQVRHDLDYLDVTGLIYIRAGPNSSQTEKISEMADYIHTELTHLKRACKDTERLEEGVRLDPNDAEGKQDHELRSHNIKKVMADIENASNNTFKILAEVLEKNKECRDALERDREARAPGDHVSAAGPTLKPIDSLKPMSNLKHTATCFEYDQAEAWSQSSNFAVATSAVQKAFYPDSQ